MTEMLTAYTDEKEAARLWKEIQKRKTFIERVDNRDEDLDYTPEQMDKEAEKYERYELELKELNKQLTALQIKEESA